MTCDPWKAAPGLRKHEHDWVSITRLEDQQERQICTVPGCRKVRTIERGVPDIAPPGR